MRALFLPAAVAVFATTALSAQAPCTKAVTACERWIIFAGGPARSKVYGTYALDAANPRVTRALVMIHGASRNADHYFETSTAAGFLAGALDNTIIIAPRYAAGNDTVAQNEIKWPEGANSWRSGGYSPMLNTVSSFDLVDEIVRRLANKRTFPN